jgi:uncharacterized protein YggE
MKEICMKHISSLMTALALGGLLLGACAPPPIVANPAPPERHINVTGSGTVMLDPDVAYINIGVHTDMPTASEATAANNTQTQQVISALEKFGVEQNDIRTTNFSIYPNVQYDPQTNEKVRTTYVVDNSVYVTVHQIAQLGELLDATVSAGANSVNSIQFDVVDKSQAVKQARDAAVKDARTQAQELAAAAGVSLGALQSVDFYNSVPAPVVNAYGKGGGGAEASVPIQSGQLTVTVTVNMSYAIK